MDPTPPDRFRKRKAGGNDPTQLAKNPFAVVPHPPLGAGLASSSAVAREDYGARRGYSREGIDGLNVRATRASEAVRRGWQA